MSISFLKTNLFSVHALFSDSLLDLYASSNFHPIVFSVLAGVSCIPVTYSTKIDDFIEQVGLSNDLIRIDKLNQDKFLSELHSAYNTDEKMQDTVIRKIGFMKKKLDDNFNKILEMIKR